MTEATFIIPDRYLSEQEMSALFDTLSHTGTRAVVLPPATKVIKPHSIQVKAICLYCGRANIHSGIECEKCGAPLNDPTQ